MFTTVLGGLVSAGFAGLGEQDDARAHDVIVDANHRRAEFIQAPSDLWELCESPIEKCMAAALCCAQWPSIVSIEPQSIFGPYRLDFLVSTKGVAVDVECDGKDFHYHGITMAQYQRDRERDRYMESNGVHVIRFKGTDIWLNAYGCAHEVSALMGTHFWRREWSGL